MKKIIVATVLATLSSTAALAADLGARAPYAKAPAMMAAVGNWSGLSIGADAGYAFTGSSSGVFTNSIGQSRLPYDANLTGGLGGGFVGYNYQMQQFVIGVEADWQAASIRGSSAPGFATSAAGIVDGPYLETSKVKDYGSLRGRLGMAFDRVLVFGTAGWAWGNFSTTYSLEGRPFFTNDRRATDGWSAGGGLEYAFTNNFLGRIEYRHTDLGTVGFRNVSVNTGDLGNHVKLDDIRLGLAYKF
ncbi:MAG: outer membrane protein [Bradyrhizobium sp.]|jgi:outer membrane immunogenic protein